MNQISTSSGNVLKKLMRYHKSSIKMIAFLLSCANSKKSFIIMIGPWTSGRTFRCKIRTQKLWRLSCCQRTSFRLTRTWCRCKQDLWKRHYCTCSLSCCGCWCCLRCWNRCRRCRVLTVDPTWPKIEHFLKRKFMLAEKFIGCFFTE